VKTKRNHTGRNSQSISPDSRAPNSEPFSPSGWPQSVRY